VQHDLHLLGVDTRKLDDHNELGRILGAVAVDGGPEAAPMTAAELRSPEIHEELVELFDLLGSRFFLFTLVHFFFLPLCPTLQA
jgi:hypothetical protein